MQTKLSDNIFIGGIFCIALSLAVFCIPFFVEWKPQDAQGLFIVNFLLAAGYFFTLWFSGRLRKGREGLFPFFLFLILFLISAYALNREMNVFESSVNWLSVLVVVSSVNYIAFAFFESIPRPIQIIMLVLLGVSLVLFVYMSGYLFPLYGIGVIGAIALGISLHVFVPLLFMLYSIRLSFRLYNSRPSSLRWIGTGVGASVLVIVVYAVLWSANVKLINKTYREASLENYAGLPGWVAVAQELPRNQLAEKVLKSDLVYTVPSDSEFGRSWFWTLPNPRFNEQRKHDPLVMMAALFSGKPTMAPEDRIRVLESIYDARHQTEERLWSDEHLSTDMVKTLVQLWPEYALSYTEKTITVSNNNEVLQWNRDEEGLYTFMLPEGAVVTALSLWIDGIEEKGILSSKQKADTAYRTIVGRERRDPSVVHWQEGNRVTLRVFPVTAGKSRKFKIGITAPLNRRDNKMIYSNIWFKGPVTLDTQEEITVECKQPAKDLIIPASLEKPGNTFTWNGIYKSFWEISMQDQPLSAQLFSFQGFHYGVRPYEKQRIPTAIKDVFLDINQSWSDKDFNETWHAVNGHRVFVFDKEMVPVTEENKFPLFERLRQRQFSLFPLHLINDPGHALVITNNGLFSPNLHDLEDSRFLKNLNNFLAGSPRLMLFNLGKELSPYLKTLKEYRSFRYEQGSSRDLSDILRQNLFARNMESESLVVLDNAGIAIEKLEGKGIGEAPDHLLRLFAYNHIMEQKGKSMLTHAEWDQQLVEEAEQAYVVTPVSSLVVLESQADYSRFNIQASNNSLKNASAKANGASPEPHEWALILLCLLVVSYLRFPDKFKWLIRKA